MSLSITFQLPGDPPKQTHQSRLRAFKIGGFCRIVKVKPDAPTAQLFAAIKTKLTQLRQGRPYLFEEGVPVGCSIEWAFPFPAAVKARDRKKLLPRTQRPDLDNLAKTVLDALTDAGAWVDDSQVCSLLLNKVNSPEPGITITLFQSIHT